MAKKAAPAAAKATKKNQAAAVKAETKKASKKVRQTIVFCTQEVARMLYADRKQLIRAPALVTGLHTNI